MHIERVECVWIRFDDTVQRLEMGLIGLVYVYVHMSWMLRERGK